MDVEQLGDVLEFPSTSEDLQEDKQDAYKWTHQNTLIFLDHYKKFIKLVGTAKVKNLKRMYEEISKEMQQITNTKITAANCENKWKVLERNYKKYKNSLNETGRARRYFQYANIMNDILEKKHTVYPVLLLSSFTVTQQAEKPMNSQNTSLNLNCPVTIPMGVQEELKNKLSDKSKVNIENTEQISKNEIKKQKPKFNVHKELRADRTEYYRKRLEIEEKILKEKIRKNELLEKRNVILEKYLQKNMVLAEFM